ncbi:MAG: Septum formation protein Maf [Firmicutes bacterium ADurb.Bin193]|nr:MAG: Septum formation protein Maf [Firmicutes bacterium ADurb.Bin193]
MKEIILASASPRRTELLSRLGLKFEVKTPDSDETFDSSLSVADNVKRIAHLKAVSVAQDFPDKIIIGADTVVSIGGEILGKPTDEADAANMLRRLSGRTHTVCTGCAVVRLCDGREELWCETTEVTFRSLSGSEIEAYINTGEPTDKAGAYGVQGLGAAFVTKINGDYNNVVGLPLCSLACALGLFGIDIFNIE